MISAVQAENLICQRGGNTVLSGISFEVWRGDALLLTGPNGSGKTTLLRTLAGFLAIGGGTLRYPGAEKAVNAIGYYQEHLHFVGHLNGVKTRMTALENLLFWQRFYSIAENLNAAENALDAFGLADLADVPAAYLSAGQGRRLALARIAAVQRPLWLLDEPASSLDAASTARLEDAINRHLAAGGLAVISTHLDLAIANALRLRLDPAAQRFAV